MGDRSLDGIIIVPQFLTDYPFLQTLQTRNFPYVLFRPARFGSDVNYVDIENAVGGRLSTIGSKNWVNASPKVCSP